MHVQSSAVFEGKSLLFRLFLLFLLFTLRGRLWSAVTLYQVLPLSESTMAANGDGEEKGAEHPSAMSLFAPATQAAVSFHITCLVFVTGVSNRYVGISTVST